MLPENPEYLSALPYNIEITCLKQKPFYHTNFKSSLENVFLKDKPRDETSIVGRLFSNKTETLKSTAKSILEEILLRETLDCHLLNKINEDISWQKMQFEQIDKLQVQYVIDWFKDVSKVKMQFENNILALEKEKREEYL